MDWRPRSFTEDIGGVCGDKRLYGDDPSDLLDVAPLDVKGYILEVCSLCWDEFRLKLAPNPSRHVSPLGNFSTMPHACRLQSRAARLFLA